MNHRRDLLKIAGMGAFAAMGAGAAPGKLPDGVMRSDQAKLSEETFGDLRTYYEGPTGQVGSMTAGSLLLKPGMSPHPPHQHEEEEFMVVTEGTGEISVEGKVTRVAPGSMMFCAAGKVHGIVNTGKAPLLFYYWKWLA